HHRKPHSFPTRRSSDLGGEFNAVQCGRPTLTPTPLPASLSERPEEEPGMRSAPRQILLPHISQILQAAINALQRRVGITLLLYEDRKSTRLNSSHSQIS